MELSDCARSVLTDLATTAGQKAVPALDALGTAAMIRAGTLDADEVLQQARARARRLNPTLNAIVRFVEPDDLAYRASPPEAPFRGVPFLLKDAFATLAGTPTTNGTALLETEIHERDSVIVERFKRAGLRIFGKTNCPEFNSLGTTEPKDFGATVNPWNPTRSAGGSSGGSAAAVAARIVPAAHGSDGAGSLRIPASCCGLVGLKPSRGRISLAPILGESVNGCMSEGVLTVSVRDSAALLDTIAGPAAGDPYHAPPPSKPFLEAIEEPPGRLRIALTRNPPILVPIEPVCVEAAERAAEICRELGHEVVRTSPPIDGARYKATYSRIWPVNVTRSIRRLQHRVGETAVLSSLDAFNEHLLVRAAGISAVDLVHCLEWMQGVARCVADWMDRERIDVWLTPTLTLPPTPLGFFDAAAHGPQEVFERFLQQTAFTTLANMTGQPAVSLPLYITSDNLPIGTQFTARYGNEALLLALARTLEQTIPWADRLPLIEPEGGPAAGPCHRQEAQDS